MPKRNFRATARMTKEKGVNDLPKDYCIDVYELLPNNVVIFELQFKKTERSGILYSHFVTYYGTSVSIS